MEEQKSIKKGQLLPPVSDVYVECRHLWGQWRALIRTVKGWRVPASHQLYIILIKMAR